MKKVLANRLVTVELSLRTRGTAEMTARGPLTRARSAAWGRYVARNINVVTDMPVVMVGVTFDRKGFRRLR
jgi:hypothetical protein